eukprot:CAMPEP_0179720014 /NCGR_PEP_ID=MMETSP0938-20121108/3727_1 /TAXON_ID=548131 ORGANISM="Ostreococcus mediterraneus, Strain clade-D-RCC1107" /NCGR_SAMPLE_ID=MMETSP0938 /ASSEMBLY_ACC=CAM_ASM_000576 /LENGTH=138 /DNA_ID=CAMNT_0021593877 /DNA_START=56 /DNA_END=473 /DNA_ORIENTATION=+
MLSVIVVLYGALAAENDTEDTDEQQRSAKNRPESGHARVVENPSKKRPHDWFKRRRNRHYDWRDVPEAKLNPVCPTMPETNASKTNHPTFDDVAQPNTAAPSLNMTENIARKAAAKNVTGNAYTNVGIQYRSVLPAAM